MPANSIQNQVVNPHAKTKLLKALLLTLLLGLIFIAEEAYRWPNEAAFYALNVGQGDALLLTTPESQVILIDGGPGQTVLGELGNVLPFVWRKIDLMVLTHPHADHMEGLIAVLDRYDVQKVLMSAPQYGGPAYEAFIERVQQQKIPLEFAHAEKDFSFGSLDLDVLYPFEPIVGTKEENINNVSVVLRATFDPPAKPWTLLLTGDAEEEVEQALVKAEQEGDLELTADVLKAGHHGSKTSSTPEFVQKVNPKDMVISCGKDNDYGHPDPETLELSARMHLKVHRTDQDGRIRLTPP